MGVEWTQNEDFLSRQKGRKVKGYFIGGQTLDRIGDGGGRRLRNALLFLC